MNHVTVRVYGSLNDFLPAVQRQVPIPASFAGARSVKDLVESLGVPHPEIELILVNGESASFDQLGQDGDRVAVFPGSTRYIRCNADLREVPKSAAGTRLPALTRAHYDKFQECSGRGRVYWQGAHWKGLVQSIERALEATEGAGMSTARRGSAP
jgi:hypothetical protein